jgi:S1-C subfamily serine protease
VESQEKKKDSISHPVATALPQSVSVVSSGSGVSATIQTTLSIISNDIQAIWDTKKDAVVQVMGNTKDGHNQNKLLLGTGFFVDADGHILTTATITMEAENLWVDYLGLSYAAKLIGKDSVTNLAVIELLKKPERFQHITLQKFSSYERSRCGTLVIFIGCALGFAPAPNFGIISGENIIFGNRVFIASYLRSNIEICGGESGAPVFDTSGNLCGVLIASLPELHSSFIIPSCALERIFRELLANAAIKYSSARFCVRGQISISGKKEIVVSSLPEGIGEKNSTVDGDYLKIGDVIQKIDGITIRDESDIANSLFFKNPGETVTLTILRDNQNTKEISITLTEKISE